MHTIRCVPKTTEELYVPVRLAIVAEIRQLAIEYYRLTGKPLGVTGEIAEYEAATLLDLEFCAREAGYDARRRADGRVERLQIKGRCFQGRPKPGERVGKIDSDTAGTPLCWLSWMLDWRHSPFTRLRATAF